MIRREFLKWLARLTGGYVAVNMASPLTLINTSLLGTAAAQGLCTPDICGTDSSLECQDDHCAEDSSGKCQGDLCESDRSGDCESDTCTSDESGECRSDRCADDKSGECVSDTCTSDKSGACVSDQCGSDKSGACVSDACVSDKSQACASDVCRNDSSGACKSDRCGSDKSGACQSDKCPADSSGSCRTDQCFADSSGACMSDHCRTDKSAACQADECASDKSGACMSDTCAVDKSGDCQSDTCHSDSSGQCITDTCESDSSGGCETDSCAIDTDECPSDATCALDAICFEEGFCDEDLCLDDGTCFIDECITDGLFSDAKKHTRKKGTGYALNRAIRWLYRISVVIFCIYSSTPSLSDAAEFNIATGDTAGLIAAIDSANANAEADTLNLAAGNYTLTDADEEELEPGLLITSEITVNGSNSGTTTIERAPAAPAFSIFHITAEGNLILNRLIIRGGKGLIMGGAVLNEEGTLTVNQCTISGNSAGEDDDGGGGGIGNFLGTVTIIDSSISGNAAAAGGGVESIGGTVSISNTTISGNNAVSEEDGGTGGGILSVGGDLSLTNVTVADNNAGIAEPDPEDLDFSSGIFGGGELKNTIVAQNSHTDVIGWQASLGNNLIGDTTGSFMTMGDSDLTGDPGLDGFTDNGTPGNGHLPLLPASQAINAADTAAAPPNDQIGTARPQESAADIGAIEFIRQQLGAIPALSGWGVLVLLMLLAVISFRHLQKRRVEGTR